MTSLRIFQNVRRSLGFAICWLISSSLPSFGHPGHSHGGSAASAAHISAGLATLKPNDSLKLSLDFYQYLAGSLASNWGTGEPLGAGGKMNLVYNQLLYRERPWERPELVKKDYWPQSSDFSYNPVWQPSQLGMRTQYQFLHGLWATGTLNYFESSEHVTASTEPLKIGELYFLWAPNFLPSLTVSIGHLLLVGSYAPVFDQFPLENFQLNGISIVDNHSLAGLDYRNQFTAGRTPVGRTTRYGGIWSYSADYGFLDGEMERTHFYATSSLHAKNGISAGILAGMQVLPMESITIANDFQDSAKWPTLYGYQMGGELGWVKEGLENHIALAYGKDEVEMGWGAPDMVYRSDLDSNRFRFRRKGSTLTHLAYWGAYQNPRFNVTWGSWYQWRNPNQRQDSSVPFDRADSIYLDTIRFSLDSLTAKTQAFRSAKFALEPVFKLGNTSIGINVNAILYFDKKATANTWETRTDEALRYVTIKDRATGKTIDTVIAASLWDREAADNLTLSPFVRYDVGEIFHLRALWSGAWYSAPVHRQRENDHFHANVTLSAWITYRFGVENDDF